MHLTPAIILLLLSIFFWEMGSIGISAANLLALASLPLVCQPSQRALSYWPIVLGIIFSLLMATLQLAPLYFLAASLLLLGIVGAYFGQQNLLPYLLLGFSSSTFSYLAKVFGFPIRIQLSQIVVDAMNWVGFTASAKGNIIQWKGHDFAVDEACMGLHLTEVGMVLSLVLLAYTAHSRQKKISNLWILSISALAFLLLMLTNLSRIAGIVLLQAPAGSLGHELVGVFSLGMYTLLPLFFITQGLSRYWSNALTASLKARLSIGNNSPKEKYRIATLNAFALLLVIGSWWTNADRETSAGKQLRIPATINLTAEEVRPSIWKLADEEALIYIKTTLKAYKSSHSPMVCWQGSGYQLREIAIDTIGGKTIYQGTLALGDTLLHTAWWYESGKRQTISQTDWRWHSIANGEDYQLVNITCASEEELRRWVEKWKAKVL